jgi:hypothetical protein
MAFGSQATREYTRGSPPELLHMQVGGGFERRNVYEIVIHAPLKKDEVLN